MAQNIRDVINNTKTLTMTDSAINTLMDFERVIDELDMYTFANWKKGELVEGPNYEKYFVECIFMWPYKFMPDPRAAERLIDYGCEVAYKKDHLEYPVKIKQTSDLKPGTNFPKSKKSPIWLVKIVMPKTLMQEIHQGSMELEAGDVDMEDIEQAYETGQDDKMYKTGDAQKVDTAAGAPAAPAPAPGGAPPAPAM
jgi:hypothetical protein